MMTMQVGKPTRQLQAVAVTRPGLAAPAARDDSVLTTLATTGCQACASIHWSSPWFGTATLASHARLGAATGTP